MEYAVRARLGPQASAMANARKILSLKRESNPTPLSRTYTTHSPESCPMEAISMRRQLRVRVNLIALPIRLTSTTLMSARSPVTAGRGAIVQSMA